MASGNGSCTQPNSFHLVSPTTLHLPSAMTMTAFWSCLHMSLSLDRDRHTPVHAAAWFRMEAMRGRPTDSANLTVGQEPCGARDRPRMPQHSREGSLLPTISSRGRHRRPDVRGRVGENSSPGPAKIKTRNADVGSQKAEARGRVTGASDALRIFWDRRLEGARGRSAEHQNVYSDH
jgi:hypothetical protein